MLPLLSDTISLSSSPVYSESNTHPSSEPTTLCLLLSSMKSTYPMLQKTTISLICHCIFPNLNVKTTVTGSDRVLSLHQKEVCFETGFNLAVFSKTTKVVFVERGLRSMVRNVLKEEDKNHYSRSHDADRPFTAGISEANDATSTLVEGGQTSTKVGWVTRIGRHLSQTARDFSQGLSPSGSRVGHHGHIETHVTEVFWQRDPCSTMILDEQNLTGRQTQKWKRMSTESKQWRLAQTHVHNTYRERYLSIYGTWIYI